ncbi:enhancer of split M2 protein [Lucilia cuprina]|uniref:enhancer of split M2 protein n=1 Tax=Lucilia cuprina TaxID=7375 RepID=UPI001F05F360|nr:enhancer of split M2 protein [Lucilia cuprina]
MFTDTKNLANLTVNTSNAAAKQINTHSSEDEKFKLKKMWKPILRLMSRKSALAKNGKRDNSSSIPNNVNLNNASQYNSSNKDSLAALEDSISSSIQTHKLPLAEYWQTQQQQTTSQQETSTKPLEFIRKASIDKTPLDTCTNCVYGRNCQHTQFHQTQTTLDLNLSPYHQHHHQQQNFNYFDAEDGCFVWSDNMADIDENALREWFWQNSWQFAENATMC